MDIGIGNTVIALLVYACDFCTLDQLTNFTSDEAALMVLMSI